MGFLSKLFNSNEDIDTSNVVSVVLLNQTQLFSEQVRNGYTFGNKWGDGRVIRMAETVPAGAEFTFSVTYKDRAKKIIKVRSGTTACDKLLQLVMDNDESDASYSNETPQNRKADSVMVGKNQLPAGVYVIGKDIPVGTYDFKWIWGSGDLMKFVNEKTTFGANTDFTYIGTEYDYQKTLILNVICKDGEYLRINGNVLVEISCSKPVQIDL